MSAPRLVGVNARMSSSIAPLTPVIVGLPVVEINTLPSVSTSNASMFSADAVNSTSAPLKYILKVPAVVDPKEVASNCAMSLGVYVVPPSVTFVAKDIRMVSAYKL